MPLSPDQQSRLDYLNSVLGPIGGTPAPPPLSPGLFSRFGQGIADLPSNVGQTFVNLGTNIANSGLQDDSQFQPWSVPKPYDIPNAQNLGERLTDLVPGIGSSLAAAAIPGGAASRVATLLGAGKFAPIVGDIAGGLALGGSQSGGEAAGQGAEFGLLGTASHFIQNPLLKAAANLAIPVGGQLLRGQNPLDQANLINTATMVALPGLLGQYARPGEVAPVPAPSSEQPPQQVFPRPLLSLNAPPSAGEVRNGVVYAQPSTTDLSPDRSFTTPGYVPPGTGELPSGQIGLPAPRTLGEAARSGDLVTFNGELGEVVQGDDGFYSVGDNGSQRIFGNIPEQPLHQIEGLVPEVTGDRSPEPAPPFQRTQTLTDRQQFEPLDPSLTSASAATTPDDLDARMAERDLSTDPEDHHQAVSDAVNEVTSQYPSADVQVHANFDAIPDADLKARAIAQDPNLVNAEGFNDPTTGTQHVISSNVTDAQRAREVVLHEVVGHHGVDQIIDPSDWRGIQDHVFTKGGVLADEISQIYHGKDASDLDENQQRRVTREYVARVAENTNLDPTLWQKVTAAVRKALRAAGINRDWSDSEIQDLVRSAHKNLKSGDTGGDLIAGAVDAAKGQKSQDGEIRDAYGRLVDKTGFPSVSISDLAKESGQPLEDVKSLLGKAHQEGRAILSQGDWSLASPEKRLGAVEANNGYGGAAKNLMVRLLPEVDASLPKRAEDAARDQQEGNRSLLGGAARFYETQLLGSRTPDILRAQEKGHGEQALLGRKAQDATDAFVKDKPLLTPAHISAADLFTRSRGESADISKLQSAKLPASAESFLRAHKEVVTEGQKVISAAETGAHKAVIDKTIGDYTRRAFKLFTDPTGWLKDYKGGKFDAALAKTVDYFVQRPEFKGVSRDTVETSVRQFLADKATGKGFDADSGPSQRISQALYISKHDLTPQQWRMMESLQGDRRLTLGEQDKIKDIVRDQHLRQSDQAFMRQLERTGKFSPAESESLKAIADQETVAPEVRALFGEHTNPFERAAYTSQKIINSVRQSKAISELAESTSHDGRKLAYDTKAFDAAKTAATGDVKRALLGYKKLPESDGYGKLAGQWVDRGVSDSLDAFNQGMDAGGNRFYAKLQNIMKLNATVLNPATHAHWWMQMPLMMAMGRVYNPDEWLNAGKVVFGKDSALKQELVKNNILYDGFGQSELGIGAKSVVNLSELPTSFTKLKTGGDKAIQFLSKMYSKPDQIIRTATYLKAKAGALANGLSEEAAQNHAIDFTNRYTFNYGQTSPLVNTLRNVPGINPFLSYSAELTRIVKNIGQDMLHGNAEDRTHAALNLALMAGVPLAVSLGSEAANLNQKDQQEWDRLRALEPDDLKGQIKLVTGRKADGTFQYFDLSPVIPAGDIYSMAKDVSRGDWKAFAEDQPLVGLSHSPIASLGVDLSTGTNQATGQKLYTAGDYAQRIAQPLLPPVLGSQLQRDIRSFSTNAQGGTGVYNPRTGREDTPVTSLLGHVGLRLNSENPGVLMRTAQADADEKNLQAKSQLRSVIGTNARQADQNKAILKFQDRTKDIQRELLGKISG